MDKIYTPSAVFDSSGKLAGITLLGSSESSKSSNFSLKLVDLLVDFLFLKPGIREDGFWGFSTPYFPYFYNQETKLEQWLVVHQILSVCL